MCPNFLRHLLALLVRAREEDLSFGLDELRHLCLMKRNKQSPGTFLMSLRPGHQIIEGVPTMMRSGESSSSSSTSTKHLWGASTFPDFHVTGLRI
ncbi:hypothetical protein Bca101_067931 [Brassica carinata]